MMLLKVIVMGKSNGNDGSSDGKRYSNNSKKDDNDSTPNCGTYPMWNISFRLLPEPPGSGPPPITYIISPIAIAASPCLAVGIGNSDLHSLDTVSYFSLSLNVGYSDLKVIKMSRSRLVLQRDIRWRVM